MFDFGRSSDLSKVEHCNYREIGYLIYKEIWYENSKKTSTPGQQHASIENTMGIKEKIYQSLELMAASYIECQNIIVEQTCDLFNHFNNYTYYYPFIDQILLLESKHGLDEYNKYFSIQNYPFTVTRYLHLVH